MKEVYVDFYTSKACWEIMWLVAPVLTIHSLGAYLSSNAEKALPAVATFDDDSEDRPSPWVDSCKILLYYSGVKGARYRCCGSISLLSLRNWSMILNVWRSWSRTSIHLPLAFMLYFDNTDSLDPAKLEETPVFVVFFFDLKLGGYPTIF